jgi:hypothetical protein
MVMNHQYHSRIELVMNAARYHRALRIPDEAIHIRSCEFEPTFRLSATVEGSKGAEYHIDIDLAQNQLFHDCPDYADRGSFCKHLGKFTLSLPVQIQDEIIDLYLSQTPIMEDLGLTIGPDFAEVGNEDPQPPSPSLTHDHKSGSFPQSIESFCINYEPYLTQCPEDRSLLCDFFTHQFLRHCISHASDCCGWMNVNPTFFAQFESMLLQLDRPIPTFIERVPHEEQFTPAFRVLIQRVLQAIDQKYAIPTAPGFQILL